MGNQDEFDLDVRLMSGGSMPASGRPEPLAAGTGGITCPDTCHFKATPVLPPAPILVTYWAPALVVPLNAPRPATLSVAPAPSVVPAPPSVAPASPSVAPASPSVAPASSPSVAPVLLVTADLKWIRHPLSLEYTSSTLNKGVASNGKSG